MGWSGGSRLFSNIIESLLNNGIDFEDRVNVYKELIDHFEEEDCDTLYECIGEDEAFEKAWSIVKGKVIEEDDENFGFDDTDEDFYDERDND